MIHLIKNSEEPYLRYYKLYERALDNNEKNIEVICVSTFNKNLNEVDSRFVNLKFIRDEEWIFFSNYFSSKAEAINTHSQIAVSMYWAKIDVQIRIKATIRKTESSFSDQHFISRSKSKNALAISSKQSSVIDSYEAVINSHKKVLTKKNLLKRPTYWGGYSFIPHYFEFWEGHESRINKRNVFNKKDGYWNHQILQP